MYISVYIYTVYSVISPISSSGTSEARRAGLLQAVASFQHEVGCCARWQGSAEPGGRAVLSLVAGQCCARWQGSAIPAVRRALPVRGSQHGGAALPA